MLYRLEFTVEYESTMQQQGLLGVWAEEAEAALGAKSAGVGNSTLNLRAFYRTRINTHGCA